MCEKNGKHRHCDGSGDARRPRREPRRVLVMHGQRAVVVLVGEQNAHVRQEAWMAQQRSVEDRRAGDPVSKKKLHVPADEWQLEVETRRPRQARPRAERPDRLLERARGDEPKLVRSGRRPHKAVGILLREQRTP